MSLAVAGMGWVTPLGADLPGVWARLLAGERAEPRPLANPETGRQHHYAAIPPALVAHLGRQPRLRRASPISYYAVAAGLAALEHAGLTMTPETAARTAVIFAISSGSVVYTRRFFEGVVKQGAGAASPMLFPETVYNAPASHLAAQLGVDGYSYTLVGDSSVSFSAVKLAAQLLLGESVDHCLVVGAEEIDWVLCEAYRDWRFAGGAGQSLAYCSKATGALLSEGAGALLLTRAQGAAADLQLTQIHDGVSFASRRAAAGALRQVVDELAAKPDCVIGSANGSWVDRAEAAALEAYPDVPLCCPKMALGEALGAGGLWQIIAGGLALQRGELPGGAGGDSAPAGLVRASQSGLSLQMALVVSTGLNQQASGLVLQRETGAMR